MGCGVDELGSGGEGEWTGPGLLLLNRVGSGCRVLGSKVACEGNDTSLTTGRTSNPPQASMESLVWGVGVEKQPACDHVPGTRANAFEPAGAIRGIYLILSLFVRLGKAGKGKFS